GIGEIRRLVLHVRDRAIDLHHQIALPAVENVAEVLELLLAHVQLAALDDVRLYVARAGEQATGLDAFVVVAVGGRRNAGGVQCGGRRTRGRLVGRGGAQRLADFRGRLGFRRRDCGRGLAWSSDHRRALAWVRTGRNADAWRIRLAGDRLPGGG